MGIIALMFDNCQLEDDIFVLYLKKTVLQNPKITLKLWLYQNPCMQSLLT